MAIRSNHYEVAFEAYLRAHRIPYVAVDEQRRALLEQSSIKSLDFIVHGPRGARFLVDIKGRRFPSGESPPDGGRSKGHRWENWCMEEDPASLNRWEEVFGAGYRSLLVFAYQVVDPAAASEFAELFEFRERQYAFLGVRAADYHAHERLRSPRWGTVSLPIGRFRRMARPFAEWLAAGEVDPVPGSSDGGDPIARGALAAGAV
jgi:hypothetical protein